MHYQEFAASEAARARYWARSYAGYSRFNRAEPNDAHRALAELERDGYLAGILTQNVDGLHQAAGSEAVIELHGTIGEARCIECSMIEPRAALQARLRDANPDAAIGHAAKILADGDAELAASRPSFNVVACLQCGGTLRPNVVFFGENVPRATTEAAYAMVDRAEVLLVVGTSLAVFSGLRFVRRAKERGVPVAIVNLGPTRGDPLADLRVESTASAALRQLVSALSSAAD